MLIRSLQKPLYRNHQRKVFHAFAFSLFKSDQAIRSAHRVWIFHSNRPKSYVSIVKGVKSH